MTKLSCFNDIVKLYEGIKPVRGSRLKDDIRPIEQRRNLEKRVKKYDDNCYALLDGDYSGTNADYEKDLAPILWTRDPETGDEFVRIRNGAGRYAHTIRYKFLRNHSPAGMSFLSNYTGRQYMDVVVQGEEGTSVETFPLPKSNYLWDWKTKKPCGPDDGLYLLFKVTGDCSYKRVGKEVSSPTAKIDKELKRIWRPAIESFYAYIGAIGPMLKTDYASILEYRDVILEWVNKHCQVQMGRIGWWRQVIKDVPCAAAREIVAQEDHELRPALAALAWIHIELQRSHYTDADLKVIRARYNRLMNDLLGLYELERG